MLKWIFGGGGSTASSGSAAQRAWLDRLHKPLAKALHGVKSQVEAQRVIDYIATGNDLSVLADLAKNQGYFGRAINELWAPVIDSIGDADPAQAARLARVFDAWFARNAHYYKFPPGTSWPEALLDVDVSIARRGTDSTLTLTNATIERMLAAEGLPESLLVNTAFASAQGVTATWELDQLVKVRRMPDWPEAVHRHLESVRGLLPGLTGAARLHALELLKAAKAETVDALAEELAPWVATPGKQVQALVSPLIDRSGASFVPALRTIAAEGKPEQRLMALRWLHEIAVREKDESLVAFAREAAAADKAASVQALIAGWDNAGKPEEDIPLEPVTLPPEAPLQLSDRLTPALRQAITRMWADCNQEIERQNTQQKAWYEAQKAQGSPHARLNQTPLLKDSTLQRLLEELAAPVLGKPAGREGRAWLLNQHVHKLAASGAIDPVSLARMLHFLGMHRDDHHGVSWPATAAYNNLQRARSDISLSLLAQLHSAFGGDDRDILLAFCRDNGLGAGWDEAQLAPYMARNVALLVEFLRGGDRQNYWFSRPQVFRAIALLERPPAKIVDSLFDLALGTGKLDRTLAQQALAKHPGKETRIIAALGDGKGEVRAVAAQWLQRLGVTEAVPALEKAVAKEKNDVAKGAMLDALESFGQPVEKYLDRTALAGEAARSLAKGLPKELENFPWAAMPEVRWADNGEAVPVDVLRWLLVQAMKQKSPEPNAVLRKYCAMFAPRERERLGQFVLDAWMREDVRPIEPEKAQQQAAASAQQMHQWLTNYPQHAKDSPHAGKSVAELTAFFLPGCLRQPAGSAIGSKGLLAVAACCAGQGAAAPVFRYLKEWYGTRAAQGKALIAMLAWIEHPGATQLMLSIGSRFRTKSFQEEAVRQAAALAERKGWTMDELADRTIPSAGFDENGILELSYGDRAYTAKLLADFKVELYNPDGKKVASLPEPRADDDAELAKDAKKAFSAAKKDIKGIVELQGSRLYEALCTGRSWAAEDWQAYLNTHPIVRRLLQRLVWIEVGTEGDKRSFRPLDEGSLTDVEDNAIELAPGARVHLAHASLLSKQEAERWLAHLSDYEIAPLFRQFGGDTYVLPEGKGRDDKLEDFNGHVLEAFALRGRAGKLGYQRGSTEDGGWFYDYVKRFPTLGVEAAIVFTGNYLPEENRTVALTELTFRRSGSGDRWQAAAMPLGKVPPVLLSECYNDMRTIAADGRGFVADWQKLTEY